MSGFGWGPTVPRPLRRVDLRRRLLDEAGRGVGREADRGSFYVTRSAGQYTARWDGTADSGAASASGTYFFRATFGDGGRSEQKLTLVR